LARGDRIKSIQQAVAHMFGLAVQELKTERGPPHRCTAAPDRYVLEQGTGRRYSFRDRAIFWREALVDCPVFDIAIRRRRVFDEALSCEREGCSGVPWLETGVHDLRRTDAAFENALSKPIASLAAR
jgi:hypothetical protein